jgi:hypothetical protein
MEHRNLDLILQKIDEGRDLSLIRCEIADLIKEQVELCKLHGCDAALPHLINAVGSLNLNVNSNRQPITVGLYTSLVDIGKANRALQFDEIEPALKISVHWSITYDMLLEMVEAIRDKVLTQAQDSDLAA